MSKYKWSDYYGMYILTRSNSEQKRRSKYYKSNAFKKKRRKMRTLLAKGMYFNSFRQHTNGIYAHGELEEMYGYDLVTVYNWGALMDDVEDGIYDVKFICPDNTIVKAKAFVWCGKIICGERWMKGLIVKVGDDEFMKDAQEKYDAKAECI